MLVDVAPHELEAMHEAVLYIRAMSKALGDTENQAFVAKLQNYAQMVEDVADRAERTPMIDLALVHDSATGEVLVHRVDCPEARRMAADGHPVMNMFGCEKITPEDWKRHSCLDGVQHE